MSRWNPWRALRRREKARLRFRTLHPSTGGACVVVRDGVELIYLDHRLERRERNALLAHELIHLERGVPPGSCPPPLRSKEEATVRAEVARRLVPPDDLRQWAAARSEVGPVTLADVCDEFDVPTNVALEAMRQVA